MKYLSVLFIVSILFSCSVDEEPKKAKEETLEDLIEIKNGMYTEWYPGKKQIKYKGGQDEKQLRDGIWTFYLENGRENSVTMYSHGKKEGYTVVKHPNGAIHYRGEYKNDLPVGVWTTYNEKGEMISEKDFGYPEE